VSDESVRIQQEAETDQCVCDPDGPCLGVPGESDACGACLVLDPEEPCLHDPDLCTCGRYVVDHSDPEPHHPENLDREDDPDCPVHGVVVPPVGSEASDV